MTATRTILSLFICLMCLSMTTVCFAAFVTMANFDINGDGEKEIVRTEGLGDSTAIKVYESLPDSYFYKPVHQVQVPGKIVQVPEIADFTNDGILDLYFATGADIGIVYYDAIEQEYKRKNEVVGAVDSDVAMDDAYRTRRQKMGKEESQLLLQLEKAVGDGSSSADQSKEAKTYSKIQTV